MIATLPTAADPVADLLARLTGHRQTGEGKWLARCPAHDDAHPSLRVRRGDDGRALLTCGAGCGTRDICAALGITLADLFAKPAPRVNGHRSGHGSANGNGRRIVKAYDYVDPEGELLCQKVRYEPKGFAQRRPDGNGGWTYSLDDVRRVLYRQPELNDADTDDWVHLCEGEKAVDELAARGLVATCTCEGAGKWRPVYTESLRARRVAVLADNDEIGRSHARRVAGELAGVAAEVRLVELPGLPPKGDVFDFLAAGRTAGDLAAAIDATPEYAAGPAPDHAGVEHEQPDDEAGDVDPLVTVTATELCATYKELKPVVVAGVCRQTEVVNLVSVSKVGKTYLALGLALSVATGRPWLGTFDVDPGPVLYVDCELHRETLAKRVATVAAAMGILSDEFAGKFDLLPLRGRLRNLYELGPFFTSLGHGRYRVIVLDALYRLTPEGHDENSNADVTKLYNQLDRYAEATGAVFVVVHHASKGHQSNKSVIDVGSGAGAQSRAADNHLVLRPHADEGVVVMESAIRSFAPMPPMCIRWEWPRWTPAPECDPADLADVKPKRIKAEQAAVDPTPNPEPWTPERFAATFAAADPREQKLIMSRAELAGVSARQAPMLCRLAIADGLLHRWTFANDRRVVFLATVEQPVTATAEVPK